LIRNLARPLVDTLAVLITIISIYLYYKFIKEKTKKNFVLFIISVVLAMITKDALIPIIFIPLGHTIISKSKEVSIVTALTFLIIPIIIYTSIIFSLGLWNTLLLRQTVLERYGEYHSIYYFVVSLALLLQLILPLFFIGFKGINKIKELRILIVWISIYVFARIIMPGPFDDRLWLPIMFSMIIIGYRGLEIVLKRFETTRMMELTVLGILIAIPYLMISYRIYLLI
jgi:hypothetical protein